MADPYRTNAQVSPSLESEDMSSFFLNFLQGTSASASAATGFYNRSAPAPVAESSSSLNFSDPGRFYTAEFKEGVENVFASAGLGDCDGMNSANRREFLEDDKVDNFGFSSEYHCPLSALRNGLSLYPGYVPGPLQSVQLPSGNEFDGRSFMLSANGGATLPVNREMPQTAFEISNQNLPGKPTITSQNTENAVALETTIQNHYGLLNHLASSKDMCRDNTLSRLHLDMSCSGNNSSSGVSS